LFPAETCSIALLDYRTRPDCAFAFRDGYEGTVNCARERFENHPGTFALTGNVIAYSYESKNGLAKVIVTLDESRKPVSTFFESAPYGSHEELMDAAQAIKDCAEYGRKSARSERRRNAPRMVGV
jgi:hypothetical protein